MVKNIIEKLDKLNKLQNLSKKNKDLNIENKKLKKDLETQKMKTLAFSTMIDVAEKMFKIQIRKK